MKDGARLLRNIGSNYVQDVLLAIISLFLTPFIYLRLGAAGAGGIGLTGASTGLLRLLDIGLAHAVARFVSRSVALEDKDEVNRVVTTAMALYVCLGLVAFGIVAALGAFCLGALGVSELEQPAARWVFLFAGMSLAVRFPGNALEGALRGLQRFDLANVAPLADRIVYAACVTIVLAWFGWGLAAVGCCVFIGSIVEQLVRVFSVRAAYRSLRIGWEWVSLRTAREMLGFGTMASMTQIASFLEQTVLRFLVSAALGSAVLAKYHLVMTVVGLVPQLSIGVKSVIMPFASRYHAINDGERLRRLLLDGSKLVLAMVLPAVVWVVVMARPILLTWVGVDMESWSFMLQCMMAAFAADRFCGSGDMVLMGMGRVRATGVAYVTGSVFAISLLTVLLWGTDVGVYSVPVALSAGILIRQSVVLMRMCRAAAVSVGRYVWSVLAPSLACAVVVGALLTVARNYWFGPGWTSLIASALLSGAVQLSATWLIVLSREQRETAIAWLRPGRTSGVASK